MKVCIVNHGFNIGGVERVSINLASLLQDNGNHVTLYDFSGENRYFYDVNKQVERPSVKKYNNLHTRVQRKIIKLSYKLQRKSVNISSVYKYEVEDLINFIINTKQEVVILCQGLLTALGRIIKEKIPSIKIIAWQHNDFDVYVNNYCKYFVEDYLLGIKNADLVVCLTEAELAKYKPINNNSCYIYNPLTIMQSKISDLDSKSIIFVSRLKIEQKGLDYLIPIANALRSGWKITVAGDGEDKDKFINMINENKLKNKIQYKGTLKSNELVDFYASGSIFISTSRWEGFGLVITEAMANGLPVVSFDNVGPREILENGKYGVLVENFNIENFILELQNLIDNKSLREYYQKMSLERVKRFENSEITKVWMLKLTELIS